MTRADIPIAVVLDGLDLDLATAHFGQAEWRGLDVAGGVNIEIKGRSWLLCGERVKKRSGSGTLSQASDRKDAPGGGRQAEGASQQQHQQKRRIFSRSLRFCLVCGWR